MLTRGEAMALEPALANTPRTIVGGIHAFNDESGDAYLYCKNLAEFAGSPALQREIPVRRNHQGFPRQEGNRIDAVVTDHGRNHGRRLMSWRWVPTARSICASIGIDVPVYPVKGYSITAEANEFCPTISLTDGTHKIVYSRLGSRLRVAGTAEFAGYNTAINEKRIAPIVKAVNGLFPKADWDRR